MISLTVRFGSFLNRLNARLYSFTRILLVLDDVGYAFIISYRWVHGKEAIEKNLMQVEIAFSNVFDRIVSFGKYLVPFVHVVEYFFKLLQLLVIEDELHGFL